MTITTRTDAAGRCTVLIEGRMTIYEAVVDRSALLDALASATELDIDLSSVQHMDTAGLQLLILVRRESLAAGKTVRLIRSGPAALEVLDRYGMADYFTAGPATASLAAQRRN